MKALVGLALALIWTCSDGAPVRGAASSDDGGRELEKPVAVEVAPVQPKGTYDLFLPDNPDENLIYRATRNSLAFFQASQIILDGQGSTVVIHKPTLGFLTLLACKDMVVRNFTVDWATPPFAQGFVRDIDRQAGCFEFEQAPGFMTPEDPVWQEENRMAYDSIRWGMLKDREVPGRMKADARNAVTPIRLCDVDRVTVHGNTIVEARPVIPGSVTIEGVWLATSIVAWQCQAQRETSSLASSSLDQALGEDLRYIGKVQPRHARDIAASNWSIGAETMDRDYTVYAHWREHLGPLGAKKARIQSGWAKTEKERGVYDWDWIDEIVLDMVDQSVEPWVCLCYGNPIYPGGGDTGLGGGLVSSEEALLAWERYVAAFVERYAKYVDEWELWNEPRTGRGEGAVQYAKFVIRTSETIRKRQPKAEIMFAAGGSFDTTFSQEVLEYLRDQDKLSLIDTIIYHPYKFNPDESYDAALNLRKIAKSFAPHIDIRQGENGAPSRPGSFGAIAGNDWTERSQAKWALRRLLGDLGRDIPSSYFAICDMQYPSRVNYKGLLAINDDQTVHHRKLGYYAVQHVTALFDDDVRRIRDLRIQVNGGEGRSNFAAFGYRGPVGGPLVTVWRSSDTPGKRPAIERVTLKVDRLRFESPVWADLLTGRVYEIDQASRTTTDRGTTFTNLPVYDSVVVIAERKEIDRVLGGPQPAADNGASRGPVLESAVSISSAQSVTTTPLATPIP